MRVILTFQRPKDSLKLQAAYFIIQNLENNYSIKRSLTDSLNNKIIINIDDFQNLSSINKYRDSIENIRGELYYQADSILLDFRNIKSEFIIKHINESFASWHNNPYAHNYSFNIFCNYILPYRVANEDVEGYISHFQEKFKQIYRENNSLNHIAYNINNAINSEITYDERLVINPNTQSIHDLENKGRSNLKDINIYKIKVLRSFGIAAALDYTPFFSDSISGYYSTTVLLSNNENIRLTHNNKYPYNCNKVAKVYRRSFNNDESSLFSIKDKTTHTPPFLGNFIYNDISNEYINTNDTAILFPVGVKYGYLAIWNNKKLRAIDWAKIDSNGYAVFKNLGVGIIYTPVIVKNKYLKATGSEFVLK